MNGTQRILRRWQVPAAVSDPIASARGFAEARLKPLAIALALLAAGFAAVPAWAQVEETYDGTDLSMLKDASTLGLPAWLASGSPVTDGLLHNANGGGTLNGTRLTVDYNSIGMTLVGAPGFVIGGYSATGEEVSDNTVTVRQGQVNGPVYGGLSHWTWVTLGEDTAGFSGEGNTSAGSYVRLTGKEATANTQTVAVKAGNTVMGDIHGGAAAIQAQAGNVSTGNATTFVAVDANAVALATADATDSAVKASGNKVDVGQDAILGGDVYGGKASIAAQAGNASAGNADAKVGTTEAAAFAFAFAFADVFNSTAGASGNKVSVGQDATLRGDLYGGSASLSVHAGDASAGNASAYLDIFSFGEASADVSAFDSAVEASNNQVDVGQGAALGGNLYGGSASFSAHAGNAKAGNANGAPDDATATVDVSNSQVLANGNRITFGGTLQGSLHGGHVTFDIEKGTATQTNNTPGDTTVTLDGSRAEATGNTVAVGAAARFAAASSLYGGSLAYTPGFAPETYDVFTGNALHYAAQTPTQLRTLANFQRLDFTLAPALANTGTALITAENVVLGANGGNTNDSNLIGTPTTVGVVGIHSGRVLAAGDEFLLVQAGAMSGHGEGQTSTGIAQQGISLLYGVETTVDPAGKQITAVILGCETSAGGACPVPGPTPPATVNPQLKALSEGYLADLMFVTRGADLITRDALAALREQDGRRSFSPFIAVSGGRSRYHSGSHIDADGVLFAAGVGYRGEALSLGVFAEGGRGHYDSYNRFANAARVHGDGHTRYHGAGLLGRYDFAGGFYADASLRLGRTRTRFATADLVNPVSGESARYDARSRYASAHAGLGYAQALSAATTLDVSVKYLYTTVAGKHLVVAGDPIDFERMDSRRARVGAELSHQYTPTLTLLVGLGGEYEFDGKAEATTYGRYAIDAPDVRGATGLLTLGMRIVPEGSRRLSVDARVGGYAGQRSGVGGSVLVQYAF